MKHGVRNWPRFPSSQDGTDAGWLRLKKGGRRQENTAEGDRVVSPYTCLLCQTSANSCVKSIHFAGKCCAILHRQHTVENGHSTYPIHVQTNDYLWFIWRRSKPYRAYQREQAVQEPEEPWFHYQYEQGIQLLCQASGPTLRPTQPSVQWLQK